VSVGTLCLEDLVKDDDIWHLKRLNFFPELTEEQKAALDKVSETIRFKKDDTIYFPGQLSNHVYVVREGLVRLSRQTPKGGFLTLDILNPGDIFGEMALAGQDRQSDAAEAMKDCVLWAIPRAALVSLVMDNPMMALQITRIIGFRRWQIENKVSSLLCTVPIRLARLILSLADRYPGETKTGKRYVTLRLTHKDMGELIGSNREIVTATLNKFKQDGIIDTVRNYIILDDERRISDTAQRDKE
jgi:CRP/FNR family cyclic AMP-dependent transcriptional regulator